MTIAAEPSPTMLAQRTNGHPVVRTVAEFLPFADHSFDAAMATFTVHHWTDRAAGLDELGRVAPRQVTLAYDVEVTGTMWLAPGLFANLGPRASIRTEPLLVGLGSVGEYLQHWP